MALGWFLLTVACAFVWLAGSRAGRHLSLVELVAASLPVACVLGSWLVYLAGMAVAAFTPGTIWAGTAVMAVAAWRSLPAARRRLQYAWGSAVAATAAASAEGRRLLAPPKPPVRLGGIWTAADDLLLFIVGAIATAVLGPLYSARMLAPGTGWAASLPTTAASCYGDLPIHMGLAQAFLVGCNTALAWPARLSDGSLPGMQSPIFAGEPLTYPYLPDFHAAIFVRLGGDLRQGFFVPGLALAVALTMLLAALARRVGRSRLGAVLAVAMTVCAGGLGGPRWAARDGLRALLYNDVVQHDPDGEWRHLWFAFVPHILLPQRGATFAYPMAVLAVLLVWLATDHSTPVLPALGAAAHVRAPLADRRHMLLMASLCAAALPMHQAHAFIGVGIMIAAIFVGDVHKWALDARLLLAWTEAGVLALALALPQMRLFTKTANEGFGGKFTELGWLYLNYDFGKPGGVAGFYRFWWHSLGPLLHLFTAAAALYAAEAAEAALRAARAATGRQLAQLLDAAGAGVELADDDPPGVLESLLCAAGFSPRAISRPLPCLPPSLLVAFAAQSVPVVAVPAAAQLPLLAPPSPLLLPASAARRTAQLPPLVLPSNCAVAASSPSSLPPARAGDALKLLLGAFVAFLLGNYVRLQPWDRDNAKIFYIWVFVATSVAGPLLAAPLDWLTGAEPGFRLFSALAGGKDSGGAAFVFSVASSINSGASAGSAPETSPSLLRLSSSVADDVDHASKKDDNLRSRSSGGRVFAAGASGSSSVVATLAKSAVSTAVAGKRGGAQLYVVHALAAAATLASASLFFVGSLSGAAMLYQESVAGNAPLFDADGMAVGAFFLRYTDPHAVVMHSNAHVQPSFSLAGRPSLVAYYGWVSNHGYNAGPRLTDRDYAMDNLLHASDGHALDVLRVWGVRLVVAEHARRHADGDGGADGNTYLDGHLHRVFQRGRYEIFAVAAPGDDVGLVNSPPPPPPRSTG